MKLKLLLLLFIITFVSCNNEPLIIETFEAANVDKILRDQERYVEQHYVIKNWYNSAENEAKLDSFVCSNLIDNHNTIHTYFINFYAYSDKVCNEYYRDSKKLCELEMANAYIIGYEFRTGSFTKSKGVAGLPLQPLTKFECLK